MSSDDRDRPSAGTLVYDRRLGDLGNSNDRGGARLKLGAVTQEQAQLGDDAVSVRVSKTVSKAKPKPNGQDVRLLI